MRPETVVLREIFVSTEGKPEADIPALRKKAENLRDRVLNNGDDFGEMAKHYSDSPTAQQVGRTRRLPALAARPQDRGKSVRAQSQPDDRRHGDEDRI